MWIVLFLTQSFDVVQCAFYRSVLGTKWESKVVNDLQHATMIQSLRCNEESCRYNCIIIKYPYDIIIDIITHFEQLTSSQQHKGHSVQGHSLNWQLLFTSVRSIFLHSFPTKQPMCRGVTQGTCIDLSMSQVIGPRDVQSDVQKYLGRLTSCHSDFA